MRDCAVGGFSDQNSQNPYQLQSSVATHKNSLDEDDQEQESKPLPEVKVSTTMLLAQEARKNSKSGSGELS